MSSLQASGEFEVTLTPQDTGDDPLLGRRLIDKRFMGPLDATSRGQMLSAGTSVIGSAGYVAIERVTGTLDGRRGSFILQHSATMNRGKPALHIQVVPDSGTEELSDIHGTMDIKIVDGKHFYQFDYSLEASD